MPQNHTSAVISLSDVCLSLGNNVNVTEILKSIDVAVPAGQHVAILGPSGAGKTSLLMIMAGLEQASSGQVMMGDDDITHMKEDDLAALRRDNVGIIFQAFRLIPSMTALQNVAVPMELAGKANASELAAKALEKVGLGHRLNHLPDQLSGGEQQRVAIARAIAPRPRILLADEPTGNLDSKTGAMVIDTLFEATQSVGAALILITHDVNLAGACQRILTIEDGKLVKDEMTKNKSAK
ncbi:MAG: ABC transporter ATP-binding protein [Candidatus Puniceispirillaceae bacterium]